MVYIVYIRTHTFIGINMILDMCILTHACLPYDFLKFSKFFWFLKFYTVEKHASIYLTFNLFVCPSKRQILNFMTLRLGFFKVIYFGWVSMKLQYFIFSRISNLSFYLNKNEHKKNC